MKNEKQVPFKKTLRKSQEHLKLKKGDTVDVIDWHYDNVYKQDTYLLVDYSVWLPVMEFETA